MSASPDARTHHLLLAAALKTLSHYYLRVGCLARCCAAASGRKERYGGSEFSLTDLVEKSKVEIVVVR
jgi:hypothetical protein